MIELYRDSKETDLKIHLFAKFISQVEKIEEKQISFVTSSYNVIRCIQSNTSDFNLTLFLREI